MKKIVGYEFKHSTYVESSANSVDDAVIIKEIIHYDDQTTAPNIRVVKNYKKKFYVVREKYRTFKQKRTWVKIEDCREYESNQRCLPQAAAKALHASSTFGMKVINRNPYIYGTDITPNVLLKHKYKTKFPDLVSNFKTCHLDIETDMSTKKIQMISVSSGDKVFQAIVQTFLGTIVDPIEKIKKLQGEEIIPLLWEDELKKYAKDELKIKDPGKITDWIEDGKRNNTLPFGKEAVKLDSEIILVDSAAQAVVETFKRVHEWQPDILSIWNLPFDLGKMTDALVSEGYDPALIYCDPNIPKEFKFFRFTEGKAKIPDANGKAESKDPWDRWHSVVAPSSFFWADQMSVRRFVRKHLSKEPSYALGDILMKELGHGKLKGDSGNKLTGPNWHIHMQRNEKIFYCVYNQWDNLGAQKLDEKTTDLRFVFPTQCGYSELGSYGGQGRKLADDLYFFLLEEGYILGGVSDKMESELDKFSVSLEGWICTLSPHMTHEEMGRKIIKEAPDLFTKFVKLVLDIDVKSSYPSTGVWMNIARDTIYRVMCSIIGVKFEEQRRAGLNLSSGKVNAIDIGATICNLPRPIELMFKYEKAQKENVA